MGSEAISLNGSTYCGFTSKSAAAPDFTMNTQSIAKTFIVLLAVPFSLVGAFWTLYLLGYNMSVAVWVGLIALAGLDAETGVVMLLYLDHAWEKYRAEGPWLR